MKTKTKKVKVCQLICCIPPRLWNPYKVLYDYIIGVQYFIWLPQSWGIQKISWHIFVCCVQNVPYPALKQKCSEP